MNYNYDTDDFQMINSLRFQNQIGRGSFGTVYQAIDLLTQNEVAVKKISNIHNNKKEQQIMESLVHENIVKLIRVVEWKGDCHIVMELVRGGSLKDFLEFNKVSDQLCSRIMHNIMSAVALMHAQNIIHRDLKPDNILISDIRKPSTIKIVDFGLSYRFNNANSDKILFKNCGTCIFMAPEQLQREKVPQYSKPVDVYSCGIIMYMLFSGGAHPTAGPNINRQEYIESFKYEWARPNNMSNYAFDLMKRMTSINPTERYSASQALLHPWITRRFEDEVPLNFNERINIFRQQMVIVQKLKALFFLNYIKNKWLEMYPSSNQVVLNTDQMTNRRVRSIIKQSNNNDDYKMKTSNRCSSTYSTQNSVDGSPQKLKSRQKSTYIMPEITQQQIQPLMHKSQLIEMNQSQTEKMRQYLFRKHKFKSIKYPQKISPIKGFYLHRVEGDNFSLPPINLSQFSSN